MRAAANWGEPDGFLGPDIAEGTGFSYTPAIYGVILHEL
jgi:hypothetical protein